MRHATYSKLPEAFAFVLLGFAIAVGCVACDTKRREPFDGDPAFRVSQPSRLYFANIRASSYYFEKPRGTELEVYRLRKFSNTAKRPMLVPVIVQAYLKDEAYVFVRPNDFPGVDPALRVRFAAADTAGGYDLGDGTKPAQLALAEALRRSIVRGDSLYLRMSDGSETSIYPTRAERGLFLTVMADYDRLRDK